MCNENTTWTINGDVDLNILFNLVYNNEIMYNMNTTWTTIEEKE